MIRSATESNLRSFKMRRVIKRRGKKEKRRKGNKRIEKNRKGRKDMNL